MKKNKFSCLIIGIGNIGMMYDYFRKQNYTTTHVSSSMKLKNFTLIEQLFNNCHQIRMIVVDNNNFKKNKKLIIT